MNIDHGKQVPPAPPGIPSVAEPAVFQMNTPAGQPPQPTTNVPEYAPQDPWATAAQARQQAKAEAGPQAACEESPGPSIGSPLQTATARPRPEGFLNPPQSLRPQNDQPEVTSPFDRGVDPFQTPARPGRDSTHPGVSAWSGGKTSMFEISYKKNERLFVFTQDPKDFKLWRDRVVDHLCRSTQRWRNLLEFVQQGTSPITRE